MIFANMKKKLSKKPSNGLSFIPQRSLLKNFVVYDCNLGENWLKHRAGPTVVIVRNS